MNYIQYMKPGGNFWLNIGDAVKYTRSTSILDSGDSIHIKKKNKGKFAKVRDYVDYKNSK